MAAKFAKNVNPVYVLNIMGLLCLWQCFVFCLALTYSGETLFCNLTQQPRTFSSSKSFAEARGVGELMFSWTRRNWDNIFLIWMGKLVWFTQGKPKENMNLIKLAGDKGWIDCHCTTELHEKVAKVVDWLLGWEGEEDGRQRGNIGAWFGFDNHFAIAGHIHKIRQ